MRWTLLVTLVALVGCRDPEPKRFEWRCMKADRSAAQFILDCAAAANPRSDEEGEDLVKQCEQTALRVACEEPEMYYFWHRWLLCRAATSEKVKRACERAGWEKR